MDDVIVSRRRRYGRRLAALIAAIREGREKPRIVVVERGRQLHLVAGQRDLLACRELGWECVPVTVDPELPLGQRGGLVGGRARAAKLAPGRRREIARAAALARWRGK